MILRSTERVGRVPITYCSPGSPLPAAAVALSLPFSGPPHFGYWINHMRPHPEHVLLLVVFKIRICGEKKKKKKKERKKKEKPARWWDVVSSCIWNEGGSEEQQPTPSFQSLLSSEGSPLLPFPQEGPAPGTDSCRCLRPPGPVAVCAPPFFPPPPRPSSPSEAATSRRLSPLHRRLLPLLRFSFRAVRLPALGHRDPR